MLTGKCGEKLRGPGAAIAAICWEAVIDLEGSTGGESEEHSLAAHVDDVTIVANAVKALAVRDLILTQQNLV